MPPLLAAWARAGLQSEYGGGGSGHLQCAWECSAWECSQVGDAVHSCARNAAAGRNRRDSSWSPLPCCPERELLSKRRTPCGAVQRGPVTG